MGSLSTPSRAAVPDSPKSDVGTGVRSGWLDDASVKKKRKSGSAAVGDVEALPIHIASFRGEVGAIKPLLRGRLDHNVVVLRRTTG